MGSDALSHPALLPFPLWQEIGLGRLHVRSLHALLACLAGALILGPDRVTF